MEYYKIEIEGKQFKKAYIIYLVELKHKTKGAFFYIGQTGDRNYLTARPPFRRLAGHLSDQGYSTENQVYRQIAVKILGISEAKQKKTFSNNIKNEVTKFLNDCDLRMHVFPIKNFACETNIDLHNTNRNYVEELEAHIIQEMIGKFGIEKILNKKILKVKEPMSKEMSELKFEIIEKTCC